MKLIFSSRLLYIWTLWSFISALNTWLFSNNYVVILLALVFFKISMIPSLQTGTLHVFIISGRVVYYNYYLFCFTAPSCNKIISKISIKLISKWINNYQWNIIFIQIKNFSQLYEVEYKHDFAYMWKKCTATTYNQNPYSSADKRCFLIKTGRLIMSSNIMFVHYPTNHKNRQSSQF